MKTTVQLKYNIGDVVSVKHWRDIPKEENKFRVDGYMISFKDNTEPSISYVFHAYMNKYIGYHDLFLEEKILPLGENHPHQVEIDVKDVFDNDINIGDQVYYGLYFKRSKGLDTTNSISCISGGIVDEITYRKNINGKNGLYVVYKRNILHTKPDGTDWLDARRYGHKCFEPTLALCKSVPDTFYKDIVDAARHKEFYLNDYYDSHAFKCLMDIFGQYSQAKEYLENILKKKKAAKEKRQAKKSGSKQENSSSKLNDITNDINNLSEEERQKLIEMLTK